MLSETSQLDIKAFSLFVTESSGNFRVLKSTCADLGFSSLGEVIGERNVKRIRFDMYRNTVLCVKTSVGRFYVLSGGEESGRLFVVAIFASSSRYKSLCDYADKLIRELWCDGECVFYLSFNRICLLFSMLSHELGFETEYVGADFMIPGAYGILSSLASVIIALSSLKLDGKVSLKPAFADGFYGVDIFFHTCEDIGYAKIKDCVLSLTSGDGVSFIRTDGGYVIRVVRCIEDPSRIGLKCNLLAGDSGLTDSLRDST